MKKAIVILLFILSNISCNKEDYDIVNLNGNKISALGHGGMGISHAYPMNTFESISHCLNLNSDGTEIDVEMTKDGVLVAFHDLELSDRTTGSGYIYNQTWDEISNATFLLPHFTNNRVITLETIFSGLGNKTSKLFALDCKNYNPDTSTFYLYKFCNALINLIDKYNIQDNVMIEMKREDLIMTLKTLRPDLRIFAYNDFEKGLMLANKYKLNGLVIAVDKVSKEQVLIAHQNGLQVMLINA